MTQRSVTKARSAFKVLHVLSAVSFLFSIAASLKTQERPASPDAVPDATALLLKVQENQKIIDKLQEQYACHKNVEELQPRRRCR